MRFTETKIQGTFIIDIDPITDSRGYFARTWCTKELEARGLDASACQMNLSSNAKAGTLRGLHYQDEPYAEAKLVRCNKGAIFDVAVDLRPYSKTRYQWIGVNLDADNHKGLWIPKGCGHGFQSLIDDSEVLYISSTEYCPAAENGAHYADPKFNIQWPLAVTEVSEKDRNWPYLQ